MVATGQPYDDMTTITKKTEIRIDKRHGVKNATYVEAKYVVNVRPEITIEQIRSAVERVLWLRWDGEDYTEKVKLFSIPLDFDPEHTDAAPVVIIVKHDYDSVDNIPAAEEEKDKEMLAMLTSKLKGWYPKIYYVGRK